MKHTFGKRVTAVIIATVMLALAVPFSVPVSAANEPVVIAPFELYNVMSANFPTTRTLTDDPVNMKRTLRFDVTSSASGINGDTTTVSVSLGDKNINVKDYPYIQIACKIKSVGNDYIDFNASVDKYYQKGPDVSKATVSNRLWGPTPSYPQETSTKLNIKYTQFNGGQNCYDTSTSPWTYYGFDWNWVADDAVYTNFSLKPFRKANKYTVGDYLEFDYIAFFKDEASMNSYEFKSEMTDLSVEPTMALALGETKLLNTTVTPSSAYAKIVYTSSNEKVARVTDNGTVVGLSAGTATITAKTADNKFSDTCNVTVTGRDTDYSAYIFDRSDLDNLKYKAANSDKLNIVYLGGSVTAGAGASETTCWRGVVGEWLKTMFPDINVTNVNSAMGGSGSMFGAFRLEADVLAYDPDLVFVEFAVNDSYSGHFRDGTIPLYYEYILRTIREKSPDTEIICLYVIDQSQLGTAINYDLTQTAKIHDAIAEKYGVTGLAVGRAMANTILSTDASWSEYVADSVHPNANGYRVYANVIKQYLFDKLFVNGDVPQSIVNHKVPETYYDSRTADFAPRYVKITGTDIFETINGWTWNSGKVYSNIDTAGYISPTSDKNSFTYKFTGTAISLFFEYNGGKYYLDYSIDGGPTTHLYVTDTNHAFNKIVKGGTAEELPYGEHTLTFSYKGANGTGGTNSGLKLSRILVSDRPTSNIIGDVNSDYSVDALDTAYLARYVAGWKDTGCVFNFDNSDVNNDGKTSAIDAIILARHVAGWKGYTTLPKA